MDFTPRLGLPYLAAQQAQKHVTYNEAMRTLDGFVHPAVQSRSTAAPPGSPSAGAAYIVPSGATGAWAGKDEEVAIYGDGVWEFRVPEDGWLYYVIDSAEIVVFSTGWVGFAINGGATIGQFGINTTADSTNRLAVAADASLFTNAGTHHRLKINKATAGNTASLLLQTAFSGRAEIGLNGDDDLRVKVSADGSAWTEAIRVHRSTGVIELPAGNLKFPAAANPSADAHTFDDYEEGTFTVTAAFATPGTSSWAYATQDGRYTKIGDVVIVAINFDGTPTIGTGAGAMSLGGFPFTTASLLQVLAVGGLNSSFTWPASRTMMSADIAASSSVIALRGLGSAINASAIQASNMTSGGSHVVRLNGALKVA